jgi:Fe-S-cluster containining protein
MHCSHCGHCCEDTDMELTHEDIDRLEDAGYRKDDFALLDEYFSYRLRNVDGVCFFYDRNRKRCSAYEARPLGCHLFPIVADAEGRIVVHDMCPAGASVQRDELLMKSRLLLKLFNRLDREVDKRSKGDNSPKGH